MAERLLVKGGLVIDPSQNIESVRDVLIEDGKIAEVRAGLSKQPGLKDAPVLDAQGLWVIPGLIDMHVHLREPGREGDETILTGTRAAARGGVTTVLAMPNTEPPVDTPSAVSFVKSKAVAEGAVRVLVAGAATVGQKGERLTEIVGMVRAGISAVTDDGRPMMNSELMRRALECCKDCGIPFIDHCEDEHLSAGACVNEGRAATAKGLRGMPWAGETVMVSRDIALSELTGAHVHIAHISAAQSVTAVRLAKKRGLNVTAEATPHHFTLCEEDAPGYDANFKMNPPLRSARDREAVLEGLADGTIDAVATDHAPHGPGKKALGLPLAPFGVIGLETSLALGITHLVGKKILSPKKLLERMSAAPARLLGLKDRGSLKKGMLADIALVHPGESWTVEARFESKSRNSPFIGMKLKGQVRATLVGGRAAFRHDHAL
ncbi:MAG: dihydroorotase [Elusimicrobia bacterium]|nr:dihydroorotase [Elusimicrobiota bacterium]